MEEIEVRPHRGGLEDSLKEAVVMENTEKNFRNQFNPTGKITCKFYAYDTRTGEDVYMIKDEQGVIWFGNKMLKLKEDNGCSC